MNIAYNYFFNHSDSSSWRQVELQGAQDSLQIFCNIFSLSAGTDFAIGLDTLTTLMDQGTDDMPAGNDWSTLGSCMSANDESHIYSDRENDSLLYTGFLDLIPDCRSNNIVTSSVNVNQDPGYCDITILCPPPSIPCGIVLLDSVILVIDTLERNPPWGMSQAEIDRNLGFARHTKNIIVQDILIDLLEQDSIELALEWLDSVAVRMDDFDSLHLLMLDRYDDLLQRPDYSGAALATSSLMLKQAIFTKSNTPRDLVPLIRKNNSSQHTQPKSKEDTTKPYKIWPNPANDELNILWQSYSPQNKWSVIIHDIHGKVFKKIESIGLEHQILHLSEWASGIYVIRLYSGTHLSGVEKLIILH